MKYVPRLALLLPVLAALHACGRSGSQSSKPGQEGDDAAAVEKNGDDGSSAEPSPGTPIALTEERLQAYIVYKKESHGLWKGFMEDWGKLAKTVDDKSSQVTKAVSVMHGVTRLSEKQDSALKAVRKKHGFGEDEDNRLWEAIGEVTAAKSAENPALEPSLKLYRDMQARGGEEKKAADEFFENLESTEKEGLEEAREQYGAECVDILSKHVKELHALQMDALQQMMGAPTPAK